MFITSMNMNCLIKPRTSFAPLSISRGTFEHRMEHARQLNNLFFEQVKGCSPFGEIHPQTFMTLLKTVAPSRISIKYTPDEKTLIFNAHARNGMYSGYDIHFPTDEISKNINLKDTPVFMHETQHLFDFILNPKIIMRRLSLICNQEGNGTKDLEFYSQEIYARKKTFKRKLKKHLTPKNLSEQINFLQYSRYQLYTEQNAYKASHKYLQILKKEYKIPKNTKGFTYAEFHFPEKIKYIETLLAKTIQKARQELVNG